jgi:hypothetical protein
VSVLNSLFGSLIDEFQHFVSRNMIIRMGNLPCVLLIVHFLLELAYYCHVWFRDYHIGDTLKIKLLENGAILSRVVDDCKERRLLLCINGPVHIIELDEILIFGV